MINERVLSLEDGYVAPWSHCASLSCQRTHHHYISRMVDADWIVLHNVNNFRLSINTEARGSHIKALIPTDFATYSSKNERPNLFGGLPATPPAAAQAAISWSLRNQLLPSL